MKYSPKHMKVEARSVSGKARAAVVAGCMALAMSPAMALAATGGRMTQGHNQQYSQAFGQTLGQAAGGVPFDQQQGQQYQWATSQQALDQQSSDWQQGQPPAKPEGDLAPELPEGEQPQLTGERPELPELPEGEQPPTGEPSADTSEPPAKPEGDLAPGGPHGFMGGVMDNARDAFQRIGERMAGNQTVPQKQEGESA